MKNQALPSKRQKQSLPAVGGGASNDLCSASRVIALPLSNGFSSRASTITALKSAGDADVPVPSDWLWNDTPTVKTSPPPP